MTIKSKYTERAVQLLLTTLVWMLIFIMPLLFGNFENSIDWSHIFKIWTENSILFGIFLINRYLLMPHLFFKGKRGLYFATIISIIVLSSFIFYANQDLLNARPEEFPPPPHDLLTMPFEQPSPGPGPRELIPSYANLLIMSILLLGFDSGIIFFSKWMRAEQNKLKAEKESVENKMAFLQNQISPHFFMNTLNNIHALVDIDTDEAKEAIIKLSQMMDYMLYESQTAKISLKQEIGFINSYVDLMKLRFTDDVEVKVQMPDNIPLVKMPPLLTISFIENAFKYGVSYEAHSFIHINIDINDDQTRLAFMVRNTIHSTNEKKKNSGIGLQNARNRLDLIYGKNYQLTINNNENDHIFEVNLNIPL